MRADYIKPSVYTRIYHLMEYENALALRLSLETGLRIGDCLALRPEDIDGCVISYTAQKTGKSGKKKNFRRPCEEVAENRGQKIYIPWAFR